MYPIHWHMTRRYSTFNVIKCQWHDVRTPPPGIFKIYISENIIFGISGVFLFVNFKIFRLDSLAYYCINIYVYHSRMKNTFISRHYRSTILQNFFEILMHHIYTFGTCICSNVETILSWTCHVYGPFEFWTSLGTSILLPTSVQKNLTPWHIDIPMYLNIQLMKLVKIRCIYKWCPTLSSFL